MAIERCDMCDRLIDLDNNDFEYDCETDEGNVLNMCQDCVCEHGKEEVTDAETTE